MEDSCKISGVCRRKDTHFFRLWYNTMFSGREVRHEVVLALAVEAKYSSEMSVHRYRNISLCH
jgi:hypothetical protein